MSELRDGDVPLAPLPTSPEPVDQIERPVPQETPQGLSIRKTFSALRHRNYRLWFVGQLASLVGTWMQNTAQGYLVYELTRSPAYLGYVGFAMGVPSWMFMLYGGVMADRIQRRTLLLLTQALMMAQAIALAVLAFTGLVQPWHLVGLAFVTGVANAFDAPARQSFVAEMVDRRDLTNAIALNSTMFNTAVAVGPALGGVTYALFGPGWCFAINAASFLAVIAALLAIRVGVRPSSRTASAMAEFAEGLRYTVRQPSIRIILAVMVVTSLFGLSFATLIPAWAVEILHGDATTAGFLHASRGIGAVTAALMIASLGQVDFKGRLLTLGTFLYPCLVLAFAIVGWQPLSLALMVGIGFGMMVQFNMANALVQSLVPDSLRGRVMSIYTLCFFGFMPLGSLLAGSVAQRIGESVTVAAGGLIALAFAAITWFIAPKLRELE